MSLAENTKQPFPATYANEEVIQGAFVIDESKVYHSAPNNSDSDAFINKSGNKQAECPAVAITSNVRCFVKWSSDSSAADANDFVIPANVAPIIMAVHKSRPFLHVFAATLADVCVAELTNS